MPVHQPGRVLLHHVPLQFVQKRVAGGGRKALDASIALVPFIDFLITLVVFLLMSFSATGELVAQQPSIVMPKATHTKDLEVAPIVAIDAKVVTFDGLRVADTQTLAQSPETDPITPLIQNLETAKRNWTILYPTKAFPGTVILQADKEIDFRVIKKVMSSIGQAGYANVSFAVNKSGEK